MYASREYMCTHSGKRPYEEEEEEEEEEQEQEVRMT